MEQYITFAELDDFIFCPLSLYYHSMFKDRNQLTYQSIDQTGGKFAHKSVDEKQLTTRKDIIQSLEVYSEKYNLMGKIDTYYIKTKHLVERKKLIKQVYDGYIFQLFAQYFSMIEMGYEVEKMSFYSIQDHKFYKQELPYKDLFMLNKFEKTIDEIRTFNPEKFIQNNMNKCKRCIYSTLCIGG